MDVENLLAKAADNLSVRRAFGTTPQDSGRIEAGGGFGGLVLPSGAYVVNGDRVRWIPAVDVTIAVLASLSLVRMLARTLARQRRHPRRP